MSDPTDTTHLVMDHENCLSCDKPLPEKRYANRTFCDRTCASRHWKRIKRGALPPRAEVDAADLLASMKPEQLGWVAGIIEGEGSISVTAAQKIGNVYTYPLVIVGMTDEDVVRRLHEWSGIGRVTGPFCPPSRGTNKPHWCWSVNKISHVEALCAAIAPFLSERRQEQVRVMRQKIAERTLKRE